MPPDGYFRLLAGVEAHLRVGEPRDPGCVAADFGVSCGRNNLDGGASLPAGTALYRHGWS